MVAKYIDACMRNAHYELMEEDSSVWGEIPGVMGVWAKQPTLEACREDLKETLSDWLVVRFQRHLSVPVIEGLDLNTITGDLLVDEALTPA